MDSASKQASSSLIFSTLQHVVEQDIPAQQQQTNISFPQNIDKKNSHHKDLIAAALLKNPNSLIEAEEMDLLQAAERRQRFDKIVLLVHHGEDVAQAFPDPARNLSERLLEDEDPDSLTAKGIGQSLTLSRRMAAFCNVETELIPDLVVVAPVKRVLQTAFLAFPYQTPQNAIQSTSWICHPQMLDEKETTREFAPETIKTLQNEFWGVDCSLLEENTTNGVSAAGVSREERLVKQADDFLLWLEDREERLVVVAGEDAWLNCLGRRLNFQASRMFQNGELRAYGLNYH